MRDDTKPSAVPEHDHADDTVDREPTTATPHSTPRQDPALEAFLAQQRAAMGFT